MAWPPKRISRSAQAVMQPCRLKPGTLRPLPLPSPFSAMETIITGRPYFSTRREATIPMTPWCQPLPHSSMTRSSVRPGSAASISSTAFSIFCSVSWRRALISFSRWARTAARAGSSHRTSCKAAAALSIRPAALSRGAMPKLTLSAVTGLPARPTSSSRAARPGRSVCCRCCRPALTMVRFSPVRGMTSAMVPMAARSLQNSSSSSGIQSSRAAQSLNATPAPHRSLKGLSSSSRRGSTTATAVGRTLGGRWWSVMTRSMPSEAA